MFENIDIASLMHFNKLNIPPYTNQFKDIEIFWFNAVDAAKNKYIMRQRSHHHTFFEVHFVIRGEIFYKINKNTLKVISNNYIIFPPNQKHKICSYSDDFVKLSLGFLFSDSGPLYNALVESSNKNIEIKPEITENIIFIMNQLKHTDKPFMFAVQNRILEIIYLLSGNSFIDSDSDITPKDTDERVDKAKQFIHDNLDLNISCTDIATHCHLSIKQLQRLFQKYEQKSLLEYLHEQKIKHIQKLLCDTEKSLKQISIDSGFMNEYYFNSFFKKHAGQTPGDYRRSVPNKISSP